MTYIFLKNLRKIIHIFSYLEINFKSSLVVKDLLDPVLLLSRLLHLGLLFLVFCLVKKVLHTAGHFSKALAMTQN